MKYYIWTYGCQMNTADSQHLASELERMGHQAAEHEDDADILVVNTCVVRQSAEDKAMGRLHLLRNVKQNDPEKVISVMGCMVGVKDPLRLRKRLPWVDVFLPPSEPAPMVEYLRDRGWEGEAVAAEYTERLKRDAIQDGDLILPAHEAGGLVSAHVPVVYGCSHACTFCIIPFRRGIERSRPVGEIVAHVRSLALQGVKEVTLLGQIVDRYGKDVPDGPDLADLLRVVHDTAEEYDIHRIRFLTSHPNWMTPRLLDTVAELPRVMPVIEVPAQAGSDAVLARMKRGYTNAQYRALIEDIRRRIPDVAVHTDIIVGFCGETEAQFMETYQLLEDLELDKAHLARYSPRPNTVSERKMEDDVPDEEKVRRHQLLEELQKRVLGKRNARWLGETVQVLVEDQHNGKWRGRTPQNKLVFFEDKADWQGQLVGVEIVHTTPYSMQGRLPASPRPQAEFPLDVFAG
ncbi:MAG: tRNA (N6-isopentenyl adenosine(37)-C2)-methylthiotransferase MiaB [Anaerolineae bacterium]|jgi:tRNA-2-methylthio-N6-dimethylallyladenosine synthase|nr:MAG: putative tRNA-thiotransferase [Chloroflexi bacterium OLB13]MBW7878391.1 tRNA (N6-isopentenyl adenosine(37)-C2)-methylthiotransferase MiaB [Anaerolineae bacterium]OQY86046.1 MAG: tRNA (N6-isopentenyl adenosine(37)-C2)-methylthiotransferase MiaB [Anaerolineae bacterium UTCFX5]GIK28852.1 MAG: tRNA-2-methylthio-N(6)-dimethylallyladenosine synthase [Chloroflexota bacterium]